MTKYLRISSYIRKPFLMYDFPPDPFWIFSYEENLLFFLSVFTHDTQPPVQDY